MVIMVIRFKHINNSCNPCNPLFKISFSRVCGLLWVPKTSKIPKNPKIVLRCSHLFVPLTKSRSATIGDAFIAKRRKKVLPFDNKNKNVFLFCIVLIYL